MFVFLSIATLGCAALLYNLSSSSCYHYVGDDDDEMLSGLPALGSYSGFWAKAASPSRDQTPSYQGGQGSGVGRSSPCQGGTSCLQKISRRAIVIGQDLEGISKVTFEYQVFLSPSHPITFAYLTRTPHKTGPAL